MDELTASASTQTETQPTLIWTKLHAPIHRQCVTRPRLIDALEEGLSRKVTLVSAPAGWGKTTLLSDWHAGGREEPSVWVALDGDDNDPVRFWTYVIEALHAVDPTIGQNSSVLLRTPGVGLSEVIPYLINELAEAGCSVVLILEDYQSIQSPDIHDAVTLLVERLPQGVRLLISTRSEPPLPLARWRARGELAEIDARQLSFSDQEAEALLNELHHLGLPAGDVRTLRERTEGWPAGLYLATLSLRGREDPARFIDDFAGEDRLVVDYLTDEVLAGQPGTIRSFLLRTSILERFCASLCDAVSESANSNALLEEIERSNFFLVPLDRRRLWYRYHHLFRELLRHELGRTEPHIVSELHRRACSWLLAEGAIPEAIHHAIAGHDDERAVELVAEYWHPSVQRGELNTVDRWLQALPGEAVSGDARLCLARAWVCFALGRLEDVVPSTQAAERAAVPGPFYNGICSVEAAVATLLASVWHLAGDMGRTQDLGKKAVALEKDPGWRAIAFTCLGAASYWLGDPAEAADNFTETVCLGRQHQPLVAIYALGHLAIIATEDSESQRAEYLIADALRLSEECGAREFWMTSLAHLAQSRLLDALGDVSKAEGEAQRGLELARRGAGAPLMAYALVNLANLRRSLGATDDANTLITEARSLVESCPDPGIAARMVSMASRGARPKSSGQRADRLITEQLSERELLVLRRLNSALSQREIGDALHLSLNTVKTHTSHIFRKLGVSSRNEAVSRARTLGIL